MVEGIVLNDAAVCMPLKATFGQGLQVVLKYGKSVPEQWHESRWTIFRDALRKALPCTGQATNPFL